MLSAKAPGAVKFDDDEVEEINKAQLMLLLHKTDKEVDAMNPRMVHVVLQVSAANDEIRAWHHRRTTKKRGR